MPSDTTTTTTMTCYQVLQQQRMNTCKRCASNSMREAIWKESTEKVTSTIQPPSESVDTRPEPESEKSKTDKVQIMLHLSRETKHKWWNWCKWFVRQAVLHLRRQTNKKQASCKTVGIDLTTEPLLLFMWKDTVEECNHWKYASSQEVWICLFSSRQSEDGHESDF